MKEIDLAKKFVEHFSCYDLYFEVDYYSCIDIVARAENLSIAIEVKKSFNFKVLEQAINNAKYFNYSYIAVPEFRNDYFQKQLCKDYGIGLLIYRNQIGYSEEVVELVKPKLNRHCNNAKLFSRLNNNNKKSLPGAKNGDGFKITAFGVTVENFTQYIQRHPSCTFKEAIAGISHHYRSDQAAKANLYQYIKNGVIKNVKYENKKLSLIAK